MTTTLNNSYQVIVSTTLGEGGQICPKFCPRGSYKAPYQLTENSSYASLDYETPSSSLHCLQTRTYEKNPLCAVDVYYEWPQSPKSF